MAYRKVSYAEQSWYLFKFWFRDQIEKIRSYFVRNHERRKSRSNQ